MSKGLGKRQAAIEDLFRKSPDEAFLLEDVILASFPGLNRPEKRHRVGGARAAIAACNRCGWTWLKAGGAGSRNVYFNKRSLRSYGLASAKATFPDFAFDELAGGIDGTNEFERYGPIQDIQRGMKPGGVYFERIQLWQAELDGDEDKRRAAELALETIRMRATVALGA